MMTCPICQPSIHFLVHNPVAPKCWHDKHRRRAWCSAPSCPRSASNDPQEPTGLGVLLIASKISPSCDIRCTGLRPMISKKLLIAQGSMQLPHTRMFRLRGDRQNLLAALASHWVDQQLGLPPREITTAAAPASSPAASGSPTAAQSWSAASCGYAGPALSRLPRRHRWPWPIWRAGSHQRWNFLAGAAAGSDRAGAYLLGCGSFHPLRRSLPHHWQFRHKQGPAGLLHPVVVTAESDGPAAASCWSLRPREASPVRGGTKAGGIPRRAGQHQQAWWGQLQFVLRAGLEQTSDHPQVARGEGEYSRPLHCRFILGSLRCLNLRDWRDGYLRRVITINTLPCSGDPDTNLRDQLNPGWVGSMRSGPRRSAVHWPCP